MNDLKQLQKGDIIEDEHGTVELIYGNLPESGYVSLLGFQIVEYGYIQNAYRKIDGDFKRIYSKEVQNANH
jgi:hypothetical protein